MATRASLLFFALSCLCSEVGCVAPGYIFSDITEPYCDNMNNTPIGEREGVSDTKQFKVPYVAPGLTALWSSNAIGDAAKEAGLTELYYCDLHTLSILGGVWQSQNIIVYGK